MKYEELENNVAVKFVNSDVLVKLTTPDRTGVILRTKYTGTMDDIVLEDEAGVSDIDRIIHRWVCHDPSVRTISYGTRRMV